MYQDDDRKTAWSFDREITVRARRYQDGSWRGSIETPTSTGRAAICVEMRPNQVRHVVAATQEATHTAQRVVNAYRPALASVGETPRSALNKLAMAAARGTDVVSGPEWANVYAYPDIVGDFGSDFLATLGRFGQSALGAVPFVGPLLAGGLGALTGGGGAGAGGGAGQAIGQAVQSIFGGQGGQQGGQQAPQGPFQGAVVSNVAQPAGRAPAGNVVTLQAPPAGYVVPASNYAANAAATAQAMAREAAAGQTLRETFPGSGVVVVGPVTPGLAAAGNAGASTAASLGAAELAEQVRRVAIPTAADVAATALRAVDARAAAELGDPYARAVLQRAIASESQRVRSALNVARSLLDLR